MASSGTRPGGGDGSMYRRGDQLSRYVIIGTLGRGSMGVVYTAYDPDLARTIALKVVRHRRLERESLPGLRARLLREAQGLAQLSHPNVVSVYDAGTDRGEFYIAMELIDGVNLRRWMVREPPKVSQVVSIFARAARGLASAHERGLVHRDFKPENVLVAEDGRVLVSDFGLVRPVGDTPEPREVSTRPLAPASFSVELTRDGDLIGTPAYMAPEQLRGAPASPRTDQYAFCCALFEALYGRRPFGGRAPSTSMRRAKENGLRGPLPPEARPAIVGGIERGATGHVPPWLRDLVVRGLDPRPSARFSSMREIADRLEGTPSRRRRRWQLAGSVAAFFVVTSGIVALGLRRPADSPCAGAGAPTSSGWTELAKADIAQAFSDAGSEAADGVIASVDDYVADWDLAHRKICRATWVHGQQTAELLDARMTCLSEQWRDVDATISLLREADRDVVAHADRLVAALSPVQRCLRLEVQPRHAPPTDVAQRARWDRALDGLARVEALREAGKIPEATRALEDVDRGLPELSDPTLSARAATLRALLLLDAGGTGAARRQLQRALRVVRRVEAAELETEIWLGLAAVASDDEEGPSADFAARMAMAASVRAGNADRIEVRARPWLADRPAQR